MLKRNREARLERRKPIPYTKIRELNIFTLSNFISLTRVLLLPVFYFAISLDSDRGNLLAVCIIGAAALTDFLDGWLARIRGTISSFGQIIDPVADKLFLGGVALVLISLRGLPVWLFGVILMRDAAILIASAMLIKSHKVVFPSNMWGKLYTVSVAFVMFDYMLDLGWKVPLQYVVMIMAVLSFFSYKIIAQKYIATIEDE